MRIYPIMTRKHEMISSETSVPVRIFRRYCVDIITHYTFQNGLVTDNRMEEVLKDHYNTEGKEINMSLIWIMGSEMSIDFHEIKKNSFHGVNVLARTIVKYWGLSFFIYKYFE